MGLHEREMQFAKLGITSLLCALGELVLVLSPAKFRSMGWVTTLKKKFVLLKNCTTLILALIRGLSNGD